MDSRTEEERPEGPGEETAPAPATAGPPDPPPTIHSLLLPAQQEMKAQLRRLKDCILSERREAAVAAAAAGASRVNLGHWLAQLQAAHTTSESRLRNLDSSLANIREQQEVERAALGAASEAAAAEAAAVSTKRSRVQRLHAELSKVQKSLYDAEDAQRWEAAELAATKRAAFAAEERAGQAVEVNRQQDHRLVALRATLEGLHAITASDTNAAARAEAAREAAALGAREAAAAGEAAAACAAQLERQWESALGEMRMVDAALMEAVNQAEELASKRAALEREAVKVGAETAAQTEANWRAGRHIGKLMEAISATAAQTAALREQERGVELRHETTTAEAERVAAEGAVAEAAAKVAEGHVDELCQQRFRAETACSEVQGRLAAALERLALADGASAAALRDLRDAEAETLEKTASIHSLESTIKKLEEEAKTAQAEVEASAAELAAAEAAAAAAAAEVSSKQADINTTLREIETSTREVQAFNRERQRLAAARREEDTGPLVAEIDRLRTEIQEKEASRRAIQARWVEAQDALLAAGRAHAAAQAAAAAAEAALAGVVQRREALVAERRAVEEEIYGINGRLKGLKVEQSRLDAAVAEVAAAQAVAKRDAEAQRGAQLDRLQGLEDACREAENRIIGALEEHGRAAAAAAAAEQHAAALAAKKKEKAGEAAALRQIKQGANSDAATLQGHAAQLRRQLSATQHRRTIAATQLQRAVAASGLEKASQRLDPKHAELAAAKERLAAARLQKKADLAKRAGAATRSRTAGLAAASDAVLDASKEHEEDMERLGQLDGALGCETAALGAERRQVVLQTVKIQRAAAAEGASGAAGRGGA